MRIFLISCLAWLTMLLTGCGTPGKSIDYSAFQRAKPVSILVLPPLNDSPDIKGSPAVWSSATLPLSEAGYYVLPITLVDQTLRQNGVEHAAQAQDIAIEKLRDYFGSDAAVYIKVKRYGTTYSVISSDTVVVAEARIVDLRSGDVLWQGEAGASSAEQYQSAQGGVVGLLVAALVKQIVNTSTDAAYQYAGMASTRLLNASRPNGILPGPHSPQYGKLPGGK